MQRYGNVSEVHEWEFMGLYWQIFAVYIDDIVIWADTMKDHTLHVQLDLKKLREAGICVSIKKSILFADEIHFPGHIISSHEIEPAQMKADKILAACTLSSPSDIKEFLGLVNYIAQFLPGLSE